MLFRSMTADQLRALASDGVTFAAHGLFHNPLNERESAGVLHREIREARAALQAMVQAPVDYFVYPYGTACRAAAELVQESGYRGALTSLHGCLRRGNDLFALPRLAGECGLSHLRWQMAQLSA